MKIRIRAWHTKQKKMYSPEEMAEDQMCLLPTGEFINVHPNPKFSVIDNNGTMLPLLSTGFLDKNGKEIWEGDIVKCGGPIWNPNDVSIRVVQWEYVGWNLTHTENPIYKVIGNIYENPELLEAK